MRGPSPCGGATFGQVLLAGLRQAVQAMEQREPVNSAPLWFLLQFPPLGYFVGLFLLLFLPWTYALASMKVK